MKRILKIAAVLLMILTLSGCQNQRELNSIGIVLGVALDTSDNPGEIEMTAQLVNAADIKTSGSSPYINITASGTDVMSIFRGFTHEISRKLYIPHNQVLIFGEEKARSGVRDSLDFFLRDHESRLTIQVLVAKGNAGEVLEYEPHYSDLPATDIQQILKARSATSQTPEMQLIDFMQCLTRPQCASLVPLIETRITDDEKDVYIAGSAVFKDDKMVGEMDMTETRGVLWVTDKVKSGVLRISMEDQDINLEIIQASGSFEPVFEEDGNIRIKIKIDNRSSIASFTGARDVSTKENVERLKNLAKEQIALEIQQAFKKSKELKSDVFGFGNSIRRHDPKRWKTLEDNWEAVYDKIEMDIQTEIKITGLGSLTKPGYPENEITQ